MNSSLSCLPFICLLLAIPSLAQDIPDSVIIGRIKANRTHFAEFDTGQSLKTSALASGQDAERHRVSLDTPAICNNCPQNAPEDNAGIENAAKESDFVATGTIVRSISALTAKEGFVFTSSEFKVQEVWKGSVSPLVVEDGGTSNEITIATPGGQVKSQGHTLRASVDDRKPLLVGHTYLLFLKYMPDSHSYKEGASLVGFDLSGASIVPLSTSMHGIDTRPVENKTEYLAAVRSSVNRSEERQSK